MQREQFLITSTAGHNAIKHKWNSARKEVQALMQAWVNVEAEKELLHILQYNLVDSTSEKDSRGMHTSGVMVYREAVTGKEISFFITKIA